MSLKSVFLFSSRYLNPLLRYEIFILFKTLEKYERTRDLYFSCKLVLNFFPGIVYYVFLGISRLEFGIVQRDELRMRNSNEG